MARKFINLDEAAQMLGVSPDTLSEMRDRGKVHGYRDGASWKFKPEEIERLIADREAAEQEGDFAEVDEDPDSILLSEVELGQSDESTSSTIIGGKNSLVDPSESDIQIATPKHDSDIDLDSSALALEPESGGSDIFGSSETVKTGSGVSPRFDEMDALDLDLPSAADSGISSKIFSDVVPASSIEGGSKAAGSDATKPEGSGLAFGSEDELSLGEATADEEIQAEDEEQLIDTAEGGSAIDLAGDEDGELVLGGSSHGDLSRTGDSGISLLDPSDSGLSLESAPLELGGSAVESLELGEDDMILTEDEAAAASDAGGAAVEQESDDDFLLTPLEEASAEESDSGSQVIALDEDVEFEDAGPGASGIGTLEEGAGLLEDDLGEQLGGGLGGGVLTPAPAPHPAAAAGAAAAAAAPETPFSGWNILSLALCSVLLLVIGMFMFDLLRNMWSWQQPYSVNSSLMDMVLSWFEG
jgi:excisionase family DNA binding protein